MFVSVCVCVSVTFLHKTKKEKATNSYSLECICVGGLCGLCGCVEGIIPFLYLTLPFFTFCRSSFSCFFLCRSPFSVWHKPFPYCFNKHLKCLAPNLCTLYTQNVSHNQHQHPPICGSEWGRTGMPRYR